MLVSQLQKLGLLFSEATFCDLTASAFNVDSSGRQPGVDSDCDGFMLFVGLSSAALDVGAMTRIDIASTAGTSRLEKEAALKDSAILLLLIIIRYPDIMSYQINSNKLERIFRAAQVNQCHQC